MNKLREISILLSFFMTLIACGGGGSGIFPTPTPTPIPTPTPVQTVSVTVSNTVTGAPFKLAMSTSFQPAEWDYQFFTNHPTAIGPLGNLNASHIRIQAVSQAIPQTGVSAWNFAMLDAIVQPVLGVGDNSPEFQVAFAPAFMYQANTKIFNDGKAFGMFSDYAANLVKYYNGPGIPNPSGGANLIAPVAGTHHSPTGASTTNRTSMDSTIPQGTTRQPTTQRFTTSRFPRCRQSIPA